jgi:hypothetical protein
MQKFSKFGRIVSVTPLPQPIKNSFVKDILISIIMQRYFLMIADNPLWDLAAVLVTFSSG